MSAGLSAYPTCFGSLQRELPGPGRLATTSVVLAHERRRVRHCAGRVTWYFLASRWGCECPESVPIIHYAWRFVRGFTARLVGRRLPRLPLATHSRTFSRRHGFQGLHQMACAVHHSQHTHVPFGCAYRPPPRPRVKVPGGRPAAPFGYAAVAGLPNGTVIIPKPTAFLWRRRSGRWRRRPSGTCRQAGSLGHVRPRGVFACP